MDPSASHWVNVICLWKSNAKWQINLVFEKVFFVKGFNGNRIQDLFPPKTEDRKQCDTIWSKSSKSKHYIITMDIRIQISYASSGIMGPRVFIELLYLSQRQGSFYSILLSIPILNKILKRSKRNEEGVTNDTII